MLSHTLSRLAALCLVLLSLLTINVSKLSPTRAQVASGNLVVHEWGTFTSVAGSEGYALEWRPLSFESDLPSFVYSIDKGSTFRGRGFRYPTKSRSAVTVRMETPVLYFYAKEETNVSVAVRFEGRITEWYPQARVAGSSVDWGQVKVMPAGATNRVSQRRARESLLSCARNWIKRDTDSQRAEDRAGEVSFLSRSRRLPVAAPCQASGKQGGTRQHVRLHGQGRAL